MPLFSRYVFVRVGPSNGLSSLHWIPGLRAIVSFGGQPAAVLKDAISVMKWRLAQVQESGHPTHLFKRGDHVVVKSEPLRDFEAVFDRSLA